MKFIKTSLSAIGRLITVMALAAAFLVGMVGVVYMSLRGEELKIPEVVGKDFEESEKELAALGLKIKKIASRYSEEKPNTILEQRPRSGETAKAGLMISVIVSQVNPEGTEAPVGVKKKKNDEEAIEEIEELISDTPKKSNKTNQNTNSNKKKGSTTRDVIKEKTNSNSANSNSDNSSGSDNSSSGNKENKSGAGNSNNKQTAPANTNKSNSNKPQLPADKQSGSGDTRTRKVPTSN